jgi:arsenate reductase
MLNFYGYKTCSTCKQAEKSLQLANKPYQFIDITLRPPSASELSNWFQQAGLPLKKWFNTSGVQYRELNIKDQLPNFTPAQAFALLASNGKLIKRPIVSNYAQVTVGFNPNEFNQTWCQ